MKKAKNMLYSKVAKTCGKVLTLIGVSLTFAACYAPYPPEGFYDEPLIPSDEEVYGVSEQTEAAMEETVEETNICK